MPLANRPRKRKRILRVLPSLHIEFNCGRFARRILQFKRIPVRRGGQLAAIQTTAFPRLIVSAGSDRPHFHAKGYAPPLTHFAGEDAQLLSFAATLSGTPGSSWVVGRGQAGWDNPGKWCALLSSTPKNIGGEDMGQFLKGLHGKEN